MQRTAAISSWLCRPRPNLRVEGGGGMHRDCSVCDEVGTAHRQGVFISVQAVIQALPEAWRQLLRAWV
jgi:hypothetical protein